MDTTLRPNYRLYLSFPVALQPRNRHSGMGARRTIMRKTVIASLGVLITSALGVIAQSGDPITQRQNLMKNNQEQMRTLTGMARGQAPFNAATAQAAFQRL